MLAVSETGIGFCPYNNNYFGNCIACQFLGVGKSEYCPMKQQVGGMPTTGGSSVDSIMLVSTTCTCALTSCVLYLGKRGSRAGGRNSSLPGIMKIVT